jgi:hypothetical protein
MITQLMSVQLIVLADVLDNRAVIFIHMGGYHPWGLINGLA